MTFHNFTSKSKLSWIVYNTSKLTPYPSKSIGSSMYIPHQLSEEML
jgi:hypothetical protein